MNKKQLKDEILNLRAQLNTEVSTYKKKVIKEILVKLTDQYNEEYPVNINPTIKEDVKIEYLNTKQLATNKIKIISSIKDKIIKIDEFDTLKILNCFNLQVEINKCDNVIIENSGNLRISGKVNQIRINKTDDVKLELFKESNIGLEESSNIIIKERFKNEDIKIKRCSVVDFSCPFESKNYQIEKIN